MTKMKLNLNWGLFPEVTFKWGLIPTPPSRTIERDFPTPFYKESFQEVIAAGRKAHLIILEVDDKKYTLTFDGSKVQLLEDTT